MSIVCGCGRKVETQPEWAGQWITCPGCSGALYSPFPGAKPSAPTVAAPGEFEEFPVTPVSTPTKLCPLCAETIPVPDPKCKFCGGDTTTRPPAPAASPAPAPAPRVQVGDGGVAALVVSLLGYMFCGLLCPIGWFMAANHEAECRRRGVEVAGAVKAAKIIGILGTVFLMLSIVGFVLMAVTS